MTMMTDTCARQKTCGTRSQDCPPPPQYGHHIQTIQLMSTAWKCSKYEEYLLILAASTVALL
jgi:hypothetical protein